MKITKLENFKGFKFEIDMLPIVEKHAESTRDKLRSEPKWKRQRRSPGYNAGWIAQTLDKSKNEASAVVRNQTDWQLTWLLEHGHLITNKKGGVGFARPHPHIKPIFDEEQKSFIDDMKKAKIESK